MSADRRIAKDLVDDLPEEKLKEAIEALEKIREDGTEEAWHVWGALGDDAAEGTWEDASENHDFYLYGIKR